MGILLVFNQIRVLHAFQLVLEGILEGSSVGNRHQGHAVFGYEGLTVLGHAFKVAFLHRFELGTVVVIESLLSGVMVLAFLLELFGLSLEPFQDL